MRLSLLMLCIFLASLSVHAQVAINSNGGAPHSSAMLHVQSTSKGMLIPRMQKTQRDNSINNPTDGLLIYQTDSIPGFYYFNGTDWVSVQDNLGNHQATQNLVMNGKRITNGSLNYGIRLTDSGSLSIRGLHSNYAPNGNSDTTLYIDENGGFLMEGDLGIGIPLPTVDKNVLMWEPYHAALRSGYSYNNWKFDSLGYYSAAFGYDCYAKGYAALAVGDDCRASGTTSVALGNSDTASATCAFAVGNGNRASGSYSVAMGFKCRALDNYSVAIGYRASSNGHSGTLALADESTSSYLNNTADNQFVARYAGGYRFYTNSAMSIGVSLNAADNSWNTISDSSKKHRFLAANGADFLSKLPNLRLGSWAYKADQTQRRHFGPMAQEIFAAYGKDQLGTVGCDTTLGSADMDGIMMILLQALEARTTRQQEEIAALRKENAALRESAQSVSALREEWEALKAEIVNKNIASK